MNWENGEYRPQQARAEARKERLVEAALALFAEKGFHAATTKDIAASAGVATGSFYRYFRDKKAVFLACMHRSEERIMGGVAALARRMEQDRVPLARELDRLVRFTVEAHREVRGFHREVLQLLIADADVAALARERETRVRAWLARLLAVRREQLRVDDVEAAAALTLDVLEEAAHRAVIFEADLREAGLDEERLLRNVVDMLRRYLLADPPPGGP